LFSASASTKPGLAGFYPYWNQDCELVSQLPNYFFNDRYAVLLAMRLLPVQRNILSIYAVFAAAKPG
ncbi:hypothetical protein, partial [Enterocloster clostridioformis]